MNDALNPGIWEATRLTRAGRLTEATALLQRILHSRRDPYPAAGFGSGAPTIDLVREMVEVPDPRPSLHAAPDFDLGANRAEGAGRAYLPEALLGLLDRLPRPAPAAWQNHFQPELSIVPQKRTVRGEVV